MNFEYFIFPGFIAAWIFMIFIISKSGWADLVEHFKLEERFERRRVGIISASINGAGYQNALILKYNDQGIYLNSTILFRLFHPAVFIPYSAIKDVREKKILFTKYVEIIVGHPYIATIKLQNKVYDSIRINVEKQLKQAG